MVYSFFEAARFAMQKSKSILMLQALVSIILLVFLVKQVGGLDTFWLTLKEIRWSWYAGAVVCAVLHVILSGINIWLLLLASAGSLSLFKFLKYYSYSYCCSLIMPGQAGDAVVALYLKKEGVPLSVSGVAYLVDKCITFSFMILVGGYGIVRLLPQNYAYAFFNLLALSLVLGVVISALLFLLFQGQSFQRVFQESLESVRVAFYSISRHYIILLCNFVLTFDL